MWGNKMCVCWFLRTYYLGKLLCIISVYSITKQKKVIDPQCPRTCAHMCDFFYAEIMYGRHLWSLHLHVEPLEEKITTLSLWRGHSDSGGMSDIFFVNIREHKADKLPSEISQDRHIFSGQREFRRAFWVNAIRDNFSKSQKRWIGSGRSLLSSGWERGILLPARCASANRFTWRAQWHLSSVVKVVLGEPGSGVDSGSHSASLGLSVLP